MVGRRVKQIEIDETSESYWGYTFDFAVANHLL